MVLDVLQVPLWNVIDCPAVVTAMQYFELVHETEIRNFGAEL
jgi:hypothetical protein